MKPTATTIAWEVLAGVVCAAAVLLVGWVTEGQANWAHAAVVAVGITVVGLAPAGWRSARARPTDNR